MPRENAPPCAELGTKKNLSFLLLVLRQAPALKQLYKKILHRAEIDKDGFLPNMADILCIRKMLPNWLESTQGSVSIELRKITQK